MLGLISIVTCWAGGIYTYCTKVSHIIFLIHLAEISVLKIIMWFHVISMLRFTKWFLQTFWSDVCSDFRASYIDMFWASFLRHFCHGICNLYWQNMQYREPSMNPRNDVRKYLRRRNIHFSLILLMTNALLLTIFLKTFKSL